MKNVKALNGTVIIRIKHTMQDRTESGIYKDIMFDKHGKMMISAEVQEVSEKGDLEIMFEKDRGAPRSKSVPPVYVICRDVKHSIETGDIIYFHYLVLEQADNFLWMEGQWKYYKLKISDVFLSVRPHPEGSYIRKGKSCEVVMHNEYVLGTPYWGEGWEEITVPMGLGEKDIAGKVDPVSGIVTEIKGKPDKNWSVITDIGRGIPPYSRLKEIKPGDVCVLRPNCEFVNAIENEERWVFKHTDILARYKNSTIKPVGDLVLLKLKERTYDGKLTVDIDKLPLLDQGWVVSCGEDVDDQLFHVGVEVKFFTHKSTDVLDKTHALVRECNIMGILNYSL